MRPEDGSDRDAQHVNRSELSGPADLVQARDVHGGVHFHGPNAPAGDPPPRQLPGDVRGFVNRQAELAFLDALLGIEGMAVVVVTGTAGVGKTSLALRWAHSVQHRFPDGQLYVNLRGYDAGPPVTAVRVLERFLRALGTPAAAVPVDPDERAALYRSRLADRRVLILLDNAATSAQVRPLLPGSSRSLVVVTTRSWLTGLATRDGGRRLTVSVLPEPDAINLIEQTISGYRRGDRAGDVRELARLCARLPLALRIAAERAASRPFMPMRSLIEDLRDESALWEALSAEDGDDADAVRTVFGWSYRALPDDAARLFRLLGLHPGTDFGPGAAAALVGSDHRIRQLLDVLVGTNLLEQRSPGRYELHDLLRAYALDQAKRLESAEHRRDALQRVLDWYLVHADAALTRAYPQPRPSVVGDVEGSPVTFAQAADATLWFDVERDNLVAATRASATAGLHDTTWRLAAILRSLLMHHNAFDDWLATAQLGLVAAQTLGDWRGEAEMLESLGKVHFQARRLDEAAEHHTTALAIRREVGDRFGQAVSLNALGLIGLRRRTLREAADYFAGSLRLARELDNRQWEALVLGNLGEATYELGRLPEAHELLQQALAAQQELDDRPMAGNTLFFLSMTLRELGRLTEARDAIESALSIAEEYGNPVWLAHWLVESARVTRALGRPGDALAPLQEAATIQRRIGDRSREATALDCTGETYRELGQPEHAARFHRHAAQAHADLADTWQQAVALDNLALALAETNETTTAYETWQQALSLLAAFPDPRAQAVQREIAAHLAESA